MPKAQGLPESPETPQASPPTSADPGPGGTRSGRFRLRNWRVSVRLFALIAIPTTVAALLAGYRVSVAWQDAQSFQRMEKLATFGERLAQMSHELQAERTALVERAASGGRSGEEAVERSQQAVDQAAARVRAAAGEVDTTDVPRLKLVIGNTVTRVDGLASLRLLSQRMGASAINEKYSDAVTDLNSFHIQLAQGAPRTDLAQNALALSVLARAKDAASREQSLLNIALWARRFNAGDLAAMDKARSEWESSLTTFRSAASPAQRQLYEDTVTGPELDRAEYTRVTAMVKARSNANLSISPLGPSRVAGWNQDMGARTDRARTVEAALARSLTNRSTQLRDEATTGAIRDAALLAAVLIIVLFTTVLVARSLVRPLRRLRGGALEVAGTRLPGLVDRLRDPEAAAGGIEVEPIDIDSTDEIGEVARAFDEVHREAVRLAADEAVLRGNINAMFVNLSRRSQSLIERQLRLIEELEQSERDEEQLANLFRLDHLATRMRRNCENLLVLGGQEQVRRRTQPVPLIDVVRASLSEVEQYERVALRVQGDMRVSGPVVNDLVHLLAELIENATVFSAENTKVTVSGQLLSGGGAMLQINDNGVGMSPEELEQANWRLANPPIIDFSAARRMGLFVVGRLAIRHGIRVELRAAQGGGLTAFVILPDTLVTPTEAGGVGSRAFGGPEQRPHEMAAFPEASSGPVPAAAAPVALAEPPAPDGPPVPGGGRYQREDEFGRPAPRRDTGGFPAVGESGSYRAVDESGSHRAADDSGAYRGPGESGSYRTFGDTGSHRAFGDTGSHRALNDTGSHRAFGDTGELRSVNGTGAHRAPADTGPTPQAGGTGEYPEYPDHPAADHDASGHEAASGGLPQRQPGSHLPGRSRPQGEGRRPERPTPVVPEAQPEVPRPAPQRPEPPRQVSWDTGPHDRVPAEPQDRWGERPPANQPFTLEEPIPEPPVQQTEPTRRNDQTRPAEPAPPRQRPPAQRPQRSPIFDAMQSEWFQRRDDDAVPEDPMKGWSSPADAGFQAAEAAAKPVAGDRTAVGLPKRVPGKNRVPGAVSAQRSQAGPAPAAPPREPAREQSADNVRNRFASLQRGVNRGRSHVRGTGPADTSGEGPSSWNDGETGGTR